MSGIPRDVDGHVDFTVHAPPDTDSYLFPSHVPPGSIEH